MRSTPDGRFPVTRRAFGANVSHQGQGHSAGNCAEKGPPRVGVAVQAARGGIAGKAGPCLADVRGGGVRAWLLLASALWVQGRQHAEEQHSILARKVRQERPAGRRGSTSPQASRLASVRRLGMRTQLNGKVGTGRPSPCGTNSSMTACSTTEPLGRAGLTLGIPGRSIRARASWINRPTLAGMDSIGTTDRARAIPHRTDRSSRRYPRGRAASPE